MKTYCKWGDPKWVPAAPSMVATRSHTFCHGLKVVAIVPHQERGEEGPVYRHELVELADVRIYRNKAHTRYYAAVWCRVCYGEPDANGVYPSRWVRGIGNAPADTAPKIEAVRDALAMAGLAIEGWDNISSAKDLVQVLADELADNFGAETFVVESYDD